MLRTFACAVVALFVLSVGLVMAADTEAKGTIKKVDGEKVYGRSERPASGKTAESNWNFVGTKAGNVVTVKTNDLAMELTVNDKTMTGWSLIRGNRFDLSLAHK